MSERTRVKKMLFRLLAVFPLLLACDKGGSLPSSDKATAGIAGAPFTAIDPASGGTIRGTVKFVGTAPKPFSIDMTQDPACKGTNEVENLLAEGENLANVFVYIKDGLGGRTFEVPKEPVLVAQSGCKYHPHVIGVMAGQTVQVRNADMTNHNLHIVPKENLEWNESQPPSSPPIEKKFSREEIMIPMKCNQHPWMKMYINVVKNPFFAVTDKAGTYEIQGLPPGDYTIAFVQEKLGERDQRLSVGSKETKTVDQSFKAE